ncbi:F0F1 ATP synthase subunit gamma [Patescibacteria group bacterium]|nr:F0F1 ATP synthase subunit gamma [Patescibacteria group bacterium]MCL5010265.1 F0F1 ATP synthase subunit gamma [Patescibacteria group bacterium]
MNSLKTIIERTKDVAEFRILIDIYEDIAARKIRLVKGKIVDARDYHDGLARLSLEVGSDFQSVLKAERPREAALLIAANKRLYGNIVEETFRLFLQYIKTHKTENFVLGAVGEEFMKEYAKGIRFTAIPYPNEEIETPTSQLLETVASFHQIHVFYGKFKNIVIQTPDIGEVSGKMFPQEEEDLKALAKRRMKYLYEPSLYPVSELFTKEILSQVIEQMILEAGLARLASRLMHLDQAIEKTNHLLATLREEKYKARKRLLEKKQSSMIVSVMRRLDRR